MPERLNGALSKSVDRSNGPRVRISPPPLILFMYQNKKNFYIFSFLALGIVILCFAILLMQKYYEFKLVKQVIIEKNYTLTHVVTSTIVKKEVVPIVYPTTTLIFTGDIIPARMVNYLMTQYNDYTYPFASTSEFLKRADLTIINMESPLTNNCMATSTGMVFCGNKKFVNGLLKAGVDVVSLANNHILNYGVDGLNQTIKLLKENNIASVGINNIVYKNINSSTIAFISYNDISPRNNYISIIDEKTIKKQIKEAKEKSDFVVTMFHWGREYSTKPLSDPPIALHDPVTIGRLAIDSGADLVVGNHPHIIQGYEKYNGKYIFYALGNFIFDQMWADYTKEGYVLKLEMIKNDIDSFSFHPVRIYNYSQTQFLEGKEKQEVIEKIIEY